MNKMMETDLEMIESAKYTVVRSIWEITPGACVEHAALLICNRPKQYSSEIIDWAIDKLQWAKYDYRL